MASDLPEIEGYRSSLHMARVLVQYMTDPDAIRRRISEDFDQPPATVTIARLRRDHLARLNRAPEAPCKLHDGYWPAEASERLIQTNKRFLELLETERALSAERAKALGALDSPALRRPEFVNRAWDRETEQAWRENTELRR